MNFYAAVVRGRNPGIYTEWDEYQDQVKDYPKCLHMTFPTREQAEDFLERSKDGVVDKRPPCKRTSVFGSSSEQHTNDNTNNFQFDEHSNVKVYAAIFCPIQKKPALAGFGVFFGERSPLNFAGLAAAPATQHTASIEAVTHALKEVARTGFDRVVVYTSSQYVIDCMTHYVAEWEEQGWRQENGKKRPNKKYLLTLYSASEGMMVTYRYIAGGSGQHKHARELAKKGFNKDPSVSE